MEQVRQAFPWDDDARGEFSMEVDPRTANPERLRDLRRMGFNRLSFGVQDFDPAVQQAVHREQSVEQTLELIETARELRYHSVSIDLIYGLPLQNVVSFNRTLATVIDAQPDRIAIYNYAHLPERFKPQRRIQAEQLPSPETKLDLLKLCIKRLTEAGYVYIGMDHFAKPTDSLAIAQQQGRLHRNFQGYSTYADSDLVAIGVSAIGAIGPTYSQNAKELEAYYQHLDAGRLPIVRGLSLSHDDILRRTIIHTLLCHFELNLSTIEAAYAIDFRQYFATEWRELQAFEQEGLLKLEPDWISVALKGRLLIRNIVMVFDHYLRQARPTAAHYSRTI
jgi:oxygen-independent coproporphyrinogen-3 oxidase